MRSRVLLTYVVAMADSSRFRFIRIGSDGSGAQTFNAPEPAVYTVPYFYAPPALRPACGAEGCFAWWGPDILRIADDGQLFAVSVENATVFNDELDRVLVYGSRLLEVHARSIYEQPYSYASDILLRPALGGGRTRAVRH
jgi:hypothetical protein